MSDASPAADAPHAPGAALAEALIAAGADAPFWHGAGAEALMFWLVPRWVVEAYAAGRMARQPAEALLKAVIVAAVGEASFAECRGKADWMFWRIGRAWCARLGQLERKARGMPPAAHSMVREREAVHG